jgi:hypothetical protein
VVNTIVESICALAVIALIVAVAVLAVNASTADSEYIASICAASGYDEAIFRGENYYCVKFGQEPGIELFPPNEVTK